MNFPEVKEETRYSRCVQGKEVEKLTHQNVQGLLPRRNKAVRNGKAENASPEAAGEGASQGSTEHENRSIKRGQARGRRGHEDGERRQGCRMYPRGSGQIPAPSSKREICYRPRDAPFGDKPI